MKDNLKHKIESSPEGGVELISQEKVRRILESITENVGVDFTEIQVETQSPGGLEFDFLDLFTPVRSALNDENRRPEVKELLDLYSRNPKHALSRLHELAGELHITAKEELPGFIYTIMNKKIIYPTFSNERAIGIASTYAKKEGSNLNFTNEASAIQYLETLAEKYLYHELGHIIFAKIPADMKKEWGYYVSSNEGLLQRVREVQLGNVNDSMPLATQVNEAFADVFVPIASNMKFNNRLGEFNAEQRWVIQLLTSLGFDLKIN